MNQLLLDLIILLAFSGVMPVIILLLQFAMVGLHGLRNHYSKCDAYFPRVAILIPAWNEGDVIGNSIDQLLKMNYSLDSLRIYAIDDGSTDNTPEIITKKVIEHPGIVFHLRRQKGGLGKAHTLNFGLEIVLSETWAEAILIMDADVLFEADTLQRMTRHLADSKVGAVTAYIKEGNLPGNLVSKFIGYEYIGAQAAARRAQNVLGVLACLAGGAQLHSRENIHAIGNRIDTSTFAEDTFTTFMTQIMGRRVIFEGNAIVRSEEPDSLTALWKQRFRWARGNIQLTQAFKSVWFRRNQKSGLGGIFFDLIWFSILLMPFFMIISSAALVTLFFVNHHLSYEIFRMVAGASAIAYLFFTLYSFLIDPKTSKRVWFTGIMFPGLISLIILVIATTPNLFEYLVRISTNNDTYNYWLNGFLLFINLWVSMCMLFAWGIYKLDKKGVSQKITNILLLIVGYGPVLCANTLAAFWAELRDLKPKWDKTEKTGKVQLKTLIPQKPLSFDEMLNQDMQAEYKLFWYELLIIALLIILMLLCHYYGL